MVFQSLKKEVDWDRNEDKVGESSSDYRLHESVSTVYGIGVNFGVDVTIKSITIFDVINIDINAYGKINTYIDV